MDLPSEAACWGEVVDLLTNRFEASVDFREGGSVGMMSVIVEGPSRDGRGRGLVGSSSTAGNNVVGLDVDSDGGRGGGGRGSIREGGTSFRVAGSTGTAGSCGGPSEARRPKIQGGREVSILEIVLLLPCRPSFPFSFGVGVVVIASLSGLGRSVDLLPKDIRLMPPVKILLPSVLLSRSRSFPLCLSLETDRTMR